jgi:hypothetical protein
MHARALAHVPHTLQDDFRQHVAARDFDGALLLVESEHRIPTLRSLWRRVPHAQRPAVLGAAISSGDWLRPHLSFLLGALRQIRRRGQRVFDGPDAEQRFAALPEFVTAYRGTVQAEADTGWQYGISWTLKRDKAVFFASQHVRFRVTDSLPVLLTATVRRDVIGGLLVDRDEDEVLLDLLDTRGVATVEALA